MIDVAAVPVGPLIPVIPVEIAGTVLVAGDVTAGMVGTNALGPTAPTIGDTVSVGTAAAELTPRLPTSVEPKGIPVRAAPPGATGDVGVDDEAMLLEPDPHIPDNPVVSIIPDVADIPDDIDVPEVAMSPVVAAVAGAAVPAAIPPPSKLAVDPNIPDGEVPEVEHVVPLLGIEMVPVTPVGPGLIPGDASSVAPIGIPVGETDEPDVMPSGEVVPIVGVGLAIPVTCAMATLPAKSAGTVVAIIKNLIGILRFVMPTGNASAGLAKEGASALQIVWPR